MVLPVRPVEPEVDVVDVPRELLVAVLPVLVRVGVVAVLLRVLLVADCELPLRELLVAVVVPLERCSLWAVVPCCVRPPVEGLTAAPDERLPELIICG